MLYDEGVAQRVREAMSDQKNVVEKKMFGGLSFMLQGNMCCGVVGAELMVRVGVDGYEAALSQPYARQMDFTGKPLKGFVYVAQQLRGRIVGADVVEFNPTRDPAGVTAVAAAKLMKEILARMLE